MIRELAGTQMGEWDILLYLTVLVGSKPTVRVRSNIISSPWVSLYLFHLLRSRTIAHIHVFELPELALGLDADTTILVE